MKKLLIIISILLLTACGNNNDNYNNSVSTIGGADGPTQIIITDKGEKVIYEQITPDEAKRIIDSCEDIVILDVREQNEFDEGHIPGAMLLPYTEIDSKAESVLPDKGKQILVYCRSGRRSKIASESLAKLGYTNVKEFGGIIDWEYEVEK